MLSYSQAEPVRELTQPGKHLLAEPCRAHGIEFECKCIDLHPSSMFKLFCLLKLSIEPRVPARGDTLPPVVAGTDAAAAVLCLDNCCQSAAIRRASSLALRPICPSTESSLSFMPDQWTNLLHLSQSIKCNFIISNITVHALWFVKAVVISVWSLFAIS